MEKSSAPSSTTAPLTNNPTSSMAGRSSALDVPFHTDLSLVAQRRRGLLLRHNASLKPTRSLPFLRRSAERDQTLHRRPQQRLSTVRMDPFRQSDPQKTRPDPEYVADATPLFNICSRLFLFGLLGQFLVLLRNMKQGRARLAIAHLVGNRTGFLCAASPILRIIEPL